MSKLTTIPSTVSVLTGGTGKSPEVFTVIRWPDVDKSAFTHAEIDLMRKLLVLSEEAFDDYKHELIGYREELWKRCDPDDVTTTDAFTELNHVKQDLRKLKRDKKKIQSIFTKLKQMQKVS